MKQVKIPESHSDQMIDITNKENCRNLFNIIEYILTDNEIETFILYNNMTERKIDIPRNKFEDWLLFDDRLNTEMNLSDESGNHKQELGQLSLDEYWALNRSEIEKDLYDYIVINYESEKVFDIDKSLAKILNHKENLEALKDNCERSFNKALKKIIEGDQKMDYYASVAKEAITEYVDFTLKIAKEKKLSEYPTFNLQK